MYRNKKNGHDPLSPTRPAMYLTPLNLAAPPLREWVLKLVGAKGVRSCRGLDLTFEQIKATVKKADPGQLPGPTARNSVCARQ